MFKNKKSFRSQSNRGSSIKSGQKGFTQHHFLGSGVNKDKTSNPSGNVKSGAGFTLIEILIVIGIIAVLATIVIIAINPARQFAQARNTQRTSNVNAILNAIGQYAADNKGVVTALGIPVSNDPADAESISDTEVDMCDIIVTDYMPVLTSDPSLTGGAMADGQITNAECAGAYDTGYTVIQGTDGRITVKAPSAELVATISVTR